MTCRECAEFLSDYLGGGLALEIRHTFERHLSHCPNCEAYLVQFRTTIRAGQLAFDCDEEASDMPDDLVRAILAARRSSGDRSS